MSPAGYRAALLRVAARAMVHHLLDLAVVLFGDLDGRYDRAVTFRESMAANVHLTAQGNIGVVSLVPGLKPPFQFPESRRLVDAHVVPVICLSNQPVRPRLGPNLQPIPSIIAARTVNRGQ